MTRQTMLEAARRLPRSPIYGIGVLPSGGGFVDYEIGWEDLERDVAWAHEQLVAAGVTADDHVLITTPNHENPWLSPVVRALRLIGATYTPAEAYNWDVTRFLSVLERLPITVVIGLGGDTLGAAKAQQPDLAALFDKVRLIWARPEAHAELVAANVDSLLLAFLGPALGLATPDAPGVLRINGAEWAVRETGGRLLVSATPVRRARIADFPAGLSGRVSRDGDTILVEP
ncbi:MULTISPECIES: hypothetical protein [unclassified Rhodococcus (in: high G+C Gram-positive bacteria)]|uniref:hypothetical protein n=1 Tax=unclassified Rhodococcus (in: high G+C Gram-positive bacteria) TaxID=192944 RepID=UPI00092B637B|nr:hypothetical protein [Rhodococcus sp. M8]OLL20309.1 hypothetical protein BKE56_010290 [Rhodococcus sp. M8]QPG44161.1 hypothetical protein ISO16_19910 [Rhodococcus sp. M8]